MALDEIEGKRRDSRDPGATLNVGLWNPRGGRKNIWTQLLACRELARISGRAVVIHSPMDLSPTHYALLGDLTHIAAPFLARSPYLARVASMDLTLQVSHAESFNYCAMESFLLGVPCLVGPGTPAGRFGMEGAFVVEDPTNPIQIAQQAWAAIQDASHAWYQDRMVASATELIYHRHKALDDALTALAQEARL
jgi:hypothetical protein